MDFNEYQEKALKSAMYPQVGNNLVYPALKLAGEAGEFADKVGKHWRNYNNGAEYIGAGMNAGSMTPAQRQAGILELGDALWYIAACANEFGVTLDYVALENINKLTGRLQRGTILSEGDSR